MAASGDAVQTVESLKAEVADFIRLRQWEPYHDPKAVAMSIAIEAAELLEVFQWLEPDQSWEVIKDESQWAQVADELADVLIYCLSFANLADIDLSTAIRSKLDRNQKRFPVQPEGNPSG
jgi:NTP pyrophosphatase (non-canonical NTP hydrolase)